MTKSTYMIPQCDRSGAASPAGPEMPPSARPRAARRCALSCPPPPALPAGVPGRANGGCRRRHFPGNLMRASRESASRQPGLGVLALPALVGFITVGCPHNLPIGRPSIQVRRHITVNQAIGKYVIHYYGKAQLAPLKVPQTPGVTCRSGVLFPLISRWSPAAPEPAQCGIDTHITGSM